MGVECNLAVAGSRIGELVGIGSPRADSEKWVFFNAI